MKCYKRKSIVVLVFIATFFLLTGCQKGTVKVSETNTGMGTVVQKTIYVKEEEAGKEILSEINTYLQIYENELLSWRKNDAEIAKLNASAGEGQGYKVRSGELWECLQVTWEIADKSRGALDVTVGSVTNAWNIDQWTSADADMFQIPDEEEIESLLKNVGYQKVQMEDDIVYLPEQMALDLGAVGKGIVCDKIGEYIKTQDAVTGAIITVGGSVLTYGTKPDGGAWNIAIVHPRQEGTYLGTVSVQGENYIATSGDYERYVEKDGIRYHHIMNPFTGRPVDNEVCSVTIVSDSGLLSDALSTACFVLGVQEGMKLADEFGAHALFVTKDLELIMTQGMEEIFVPELQ